MREDISAHADGMEDGRQPEQDSSLEKEREAEEHCNIELVQWSKAESEAHRLGG